MRQVIKFFLVGIVLGGFFVPALSVQTAFADRIEFGEGNVLNGTVKSFSGGNLVFVNEFSKTTKIPFEKIKSIQSDKTITLELKDKSVLTGKLTMLPDGRFGILLDANQETVSIDWTKVQSINKPESSWDGSISLGGTIQEGNVRRTSATLAFDAKREWEHDRFSFRAIHNYAEDTGAVTARNTFGAMKFDHFFTENFFMALSLEALKDKFKDVNLRAIIGLSAGYRIWNDSRKTLEVEGGVTYFSEDLNVGMDDQFASGRLGLNYTQKILEFLLFKNYLLYYPSFKQPKEYRLRNEASLISALGTSDWALKLTHIFDQNSQASPGIKDKDHQYIFSIQYSF